MTKSESVQLRVLIIDDEKSVHEAIISSFTSKYEEIEDDLDSLFDDSSPKENGAGMNIQFTSSFQGEEGFTLYKKAQDEGNPFNLVICDMRMPPGWDGKTTLEHLAKWDRQIIVLVCTAYSDNTLESILANVGDEPSIGWIEKPFQKQDMIEMIKQKLELSLLKHD